jgi:hypothetical protein
MRWHRARTSDGTTWRLSNAQACERLSPSGQWSDDDYDALADGEVVGRIMKVIGAPEDTPWMWTLAYGHHRDRSPTHGFEATREAAMAASPRAWATAIGPR